MKTNTQEANNFAEFMDKRAHIIENEIPPSGIKTELNANQLEGIGMAAQTSDRADPFARSRAIAHALSSVYTPPWIKLATDRVK